MTTEIERAYYEQDPSDLTESERDARDAFILVYLRDGLLASTEGQSFYAEACAEADRWLVGHRKEQANEGLSPGA